MPDSVRALVTWCLGGSIPVSWCSRSSGRGPPGFFEQFCEAELPGCGGRLDKVIEPGRKPVLVPTIDLAEPALQTVPGHRITRSTRHEKRDAAGGQVGRGRIVGRRIRIRRAAKGEEPRAGLCAQPSHPGHVSSPAQDFRSSQGLGHSYAQAFAALCAAAVDDVTASGRLHPGPEPVSTLAADVGRLVCSFGHGFSSKAIIGRMSEQVKKRPALRSDGPPMAPGTEPAIGNPQP